MERMAGGIDSWSTWAARPRRTFNRLRSGDGAAGGREGITRKLALRQRTVEGDLGIRFNAGTLVERVGIECFEGEFREVFPQFDVSRAQIAQYVGDISRETSRVP